MSIGDLTRIILCTVRIFIIYVHLNNKKKKIFFLANVVSDYFKSLPIFKTRLRLFQNVSYFPKHNFIL